MTRTYGDELYWRETAKKHGLRMPRRDTKGFPYIKLMRRFGVTPAEFMAVHGLNAPNWKRKNPTWDTFGFAGLLVEIIENRSSGAGLHSEMNAAEAGR